jgi:hypothetical protein
MPARLGQATTKLLGALPMGGQEKQGSSGKDRDLGLGNNLRHRLASLHRALTVVASLAAFSSSLHAQQPIAISPELKAFLARPEEQQQFGGMMGNLWRSVVENCPSPAARGMNVLIDVAPKFSSSGTPISGRWRIVGQFEGCGKSRTLNVLYLFDSDNHMKRVGLLPGTTIADLKLQQDALQYAVTAVTPIRPKDCNSTKIVNTKFIAFDGGKLPAPAEMRKTPWTEEWTMKTCAVTGVVDVRFVPNATGTTIMAQWNKSKAAEP